ncbi:UDP-glucose 4-epimerase [Niastella yeongjuensis]|uniref:UDP-glucose 4-epimerase n=1 Tax=Niastella yeongjuensis TaxID=354355 RepID=A0A1V9E1I6_9BACT|nr:NAD(P)-dependent oxidoreductase [Niastella yeongjuensis]OQP39998.1 UDP-glucose 4-epimerase [Niastella yeongjuensis]SEO13048.1 Nucleoside-diphosphate-sugar epimerase [Niastella yeongjuensis]
MKEKVLITGASGFIGFHLIEAALDKGLHVYAAVRPGSDIRHLKEYDISLFELNYTNEQLLAKQLRDGGFNYIIHAAGATRAASQQMYDAINATYALNLASAALKGLEENLKKFVFMSSLAAVGPLDSRLRMITEDTTPAPVTAYGRSKLLAEQQLKTLPSLPLVVLRPTAVYGPRERDIFIMLRSIHRGMEPYIGRVADQHLSFIYVKDLAAVTINSLFTGLSHITFNISDGASYDQYELADFAKQILNKKTFRLHLPYNMVKGMAFALEKWGSWRGKTPVLNREKLNELTAINWQCSIEKAKKYLNFYPQYSLEQGLRETLQWYRLNKWL